MKRLMLMRAPQKYVQGRDALKEFNKEFEFLGDRWLFICSNSGYRTCHQKLEESFGASDNFRMYEVFSGISSVSEIKKMQHIIKENKINVVVALGGGSAIDTAKAVAHYEKLPIVVVPTVVSTDAPCTGLSVIYNDDGTFNSYIFYPKNPEAVMVDSSVIANAPTKFLIAGMGDALATFFEARTCYKMGVPSLENGGITRTAMALCQLCYETLLEYGKEAIHSSEINSVTPALEAVIEANVYLSGVGADNGGLAVAHSFYNGCTALDDIKVEHGYCVAFGTLVQLIIEDAPKEEFYEVQEFCSVVNLPITLEEIGVTSLEQVRIIAENACAEGESSHNIAGGIDVDELVNAILLVDHLGKNR